MLISFAFSNDADFKICNVKKAIDATIFEMRIKKRSYPFRSHAFRYYDLLNIVARFTARMMIDEEPEQVTEGIVNFNMCQTT
jgi:UDP-N-acetylmuramyl pentapeptide synthase